MAVRHCDLRIAIGSRITLETEGERLVVELTWPGEAVLDREVASITSDSPLGRALLGRRAGETITVATPSGPRQYKIKKIEAQDVEKHQEQI